MTHILKMRPTTNRGFTLVELAIVLAVTGVLFLGLYRLLSGGNQQVKDSAVASEQVQLINSVKQFLGSTNGAAWMGAKAGATGSNDVAAATFALPLPTPIGDAPDGTANPNCHTFYGNDPNEDSFCEALPAGFWAGTTNAYGQNYLIEVQTGPITHPAKAPATYTFLIVTTGGDTIADADGGRISSEIGTDGGFLYSNVAGCVNPIACGSYGAWSQSVAAFGFSAASPGVGHVVSRTYYSPELGSTSNWLARIPIDSTTVTTSPGTSPNYNTMFTDLYLGSHNLWMSTDINPGAESGVGAINMQGGSINLEAGGITDTISPGKAITISQSGQYLNSQTNSPFEILNTNCSSANTTQPNCQVALQVNGDETVTGYLTANSLYAGTFVYDTESQGSDFRLKKDIHPVASALYQIMQMKPVSYALKSTGDKNLGFIAQDVEKIYPDLVVHNSNGMLSVKYNGLIAPLVSAVQDLKQQNDELRRELHGAIKREDAMEKSLKQKIDKAD